ncbi:MAG: right-handed parallel beta-helix repeat-containing protein [Dehalococcoidales bacterium]|nr:right-handed parallel beta-helix repeat-containing protein [Dehalococcoidales bacterium]
MKSNFRKILGVSMTVAMLTSMLVTASPAFALSTPVVTSTNNTVGATNSVYTLTFDLGGQLLASTASNITIVLPTGSVIASNTANTTGITVAASPGWVNGVWTDGNATSANIVSTASSRKIIIYLSGADVLGNTAGLLVTIPAGIITNPTTTGDGTFTVATSNETTAVTSNAITYALPTIGELPGLIQAKNSAGQLLYQALDGNINTAITTSGAARVEVAAGTYTIPVVVNTVNVTVIGVGAAGTVKLSPTAGVPLTIVATGTTIDNLVITEITGAANAIIATTNVTIKNCTINGGNTQLTATANVTTITLDKDAFNVTGNVTTGISSAAANLVVTSSNFSVDASGTAVTSSGNLTVTGSAFTGSSTSPVGISASTANTTVSGSVKSSTFTTLRNAVTSSGNITLDGNTIAGCGSSTAAASIGVITNSGIMSLTNNTISGTNAAYYTFEQVTGGTLDAHFNTITGNTLNARQDAGTANLTNNWWGVSTGPAASSLSAVTAANLDTDPFLAGSVTGGTIAFATNTLTAKTTAGVDVSSTVNLGTVAAAKYAANPQTVAPTGTPIAYYDVFIASPGAGANVTIRFYGAVTDNSKIYYGGGLSGAWSLADNQGVNTANGFVYITVGAATNPSLADLGGTPFVLTNIVPPPAAPVLLGPDAGRDNIPTNTGFSWSAVTGATYDFQVSTSPTFATTVASVTGLTGNVYGGVALAANTTYFWRVRSMAGTLMSAWTVSTFTTAAPVSATTAPPAPPVVIPAPVVNVAAPPPATVTVQAPPPANVTVNPPAVTVQAPPPAQVTVNVPESTPAIPSMILWVIILIGAVLIIALIVLIVRTRRVA